MGVSSTDPCQPKLPLQILPTTLRIKNQYPISTNSKVFSAAIVGLDAQLMEVEVDVSHGLRAFSIVGLPDKAVEESTVIIKRSRCS